MKKAIIFIILILALIGGVLYGVTVIKPYSRPAAENKAFQNIQCDIAAITIVPHTAGSPENYAIRDMIAARAKELGFTAQMLPFELDVMAFIDSYAKRYETDGPLFRQKVDTYIREGGYSSLEDFTRGNLNAYDTDTLYLDNLLIKIEGSSPSGAVMFVSHYDHVQGAPGAADDALAVACMLNLMQDMSKKPPLNDVYLLFTDGEESGLLGAADFVQTQPQYADEVDVLLNFEARGNRGAMLMFETSGNDYDLVRHFKNNIPQPVTMSIATAIYAMMPNGTDYTEFKNAGYHGLNFAMIEGDENYHQPTDTLENLDKDTAWQYYQTVTALGEHFGNTDLSDIQNNQKALYFPLPLLGIVVIPGWLGYLMGFLPLLLAILLSMVIAKKQTPSSSRILHITGILLLGILPALLTIFFFSGSYMLSIPAILFLLCDFILNYKNKQYYWVAIALLAVSVFISAVLYTPLVFLVQIALKLWYATLILTLLPLIPSVLYGKKALNSIKTA